MSSSTKRKTTEIYIQDVRDLAGDEYTVLGEYQNNKVKIEMVHNICGHRFLTKPNVFLSGSRCPKCARKLRKDTDYFKREVAELIGDEYSVLSEYINTHTKISFKHLLCENEFSMTPKSFLRGQRCPKCQHRSYKKTTDEFKQEVFDLVRDEYSLVGEYRNSKTKVILLHKVCRNEYHVNPCDFLYSGNRCCHCFGNRKKSQSEFEQIVYDLHSEEYSVIGTYINMAAKIEIKHNKCGRSWFVLPRDFVNKKSHCPKCNYSKGEERIAKHLNENRIINVPQYTFDDLNGLRGGLLSYDFYLPSYNLLIEYQGEFHDGTAYQQSDAQYLIQQEHDNRKRQYSLNNNVKLLEIWYWDFDNIEIILNKELFNSNCKKSVAFSM